MRSLCPRPVASGMLFHEWAHRRGIIEDNGGEIIGGFISVDGNGASLAATHTSRIVYPGTTDLLCLSTAASVIATLTLTDVAGQTCFACQGATIISQFRWVAFTAAGLMRFYIATAPADFATLGYFNVNPNESHRYAWVFNGSGAANADRLKAYVDGNPVALSFGGVIPARMTNVQQPVSVFGFADANVGQQGSRVQDFEIYDHALSAADIEKDYLQQTRVLGP